MKSQPAREEDRPNMRTVIHEACERHGVPEWEEEFATGQVSDALGEAIENNPAVQRAMHDIMNAEAKILREIADVLRQP